MFDEARDSLSYSASQSLGRFIHYTDKVKDNLRWFLIDNRDNKAAINWDKKLAEEIKILETTLDKHCLGAYRQRCNEIRWECELDEEAERVIQPKFDEVDAKFVEYRDKTVEALKRRRREGTFPWTYEDTEYWKDDYTRFREDLEEYIHHMDDDRNDEETE